MLAQTLARPSVEIFAVNDIVQLGNGDKMIITGLKFNRPANPYLGVLVTGQGKEYKFGPRHRPVKVGVADQQHPALRARAARYTTRAGMTGLDLSVAKRLAQAVIDGNAEVSRALAELVLSQAS